MNKPFTLVALSAAACVLMPAVGAALTLEDTILFVFSDFTPKGAPTDPVHGNITWTFDPAVAVTNQPVTAASLFIDGVSFGPSNTFFSASPTDCAPIQCAGGNRITIDGQGSQVGFNFDFDTNSAQQVMLLYNFSYEAPSAAGLVTYTLGSGATTVCVKGSGLPCAGPALPEPATLALFCLGLVSLGLFRCRQTTHLVTKCGDVRVATL